MPLAAGERLGPYEILDPIGAGGMGEVYKARDTRLDRLVAIKVSNERFSERFKLEAKAVAALNHPNICTLHDVGPNYLVMEYIEGESPQGPLPLDEALRIARQIADALEAAHDAGITHRDLKPANIRIKPDGTVKVLDFGLAKVTLGTSASGEHSPTFATTGITEIRHDPRHRRLYSAPTSSPSAWCFTSSPPASGCSTAKTWARCLRG